MQLLGLPVEHYDLSLLFLVTERLESRRHWENASPGTSLQTFKALKTFIETRCNALEASTPSEHFYSEHNINRNRTVNNIVKAMQEHGPSKLALVPPLQKFLHLPLSAAMLPNDGRKSPRFEVWTRTQLSQEDVMWSLPAIYLS